MRFNILHVEPDGYRFAHFLHSLSKALSLGLESLGHECCILRNTLDPSRTTIVIGGHLLDSAAEVEALAANGPYIVYQTEVISDPNRAAASGGAARYSTVFAPLLRRASVVWDVLEENLPALRALDVDGKLLRLGYHPGLEEITHKHKKDIDFLFFGSAGPHRREMLSKLAARGRQVVSVFDDQAPFRNDLIARAKVNLSLGHGNSMGHLPWPRISFLLNNRALVVGERSREQEWLQECFAWTDSERWVELCMHTLKRDDREQLATEYYETFKAVPLTEQIQKVLDER